VKDISNENYKSVKKEIKEGLELWLKMMSDCLASMKPCVQNSVQPKEKKKISIRAGRVALRCRVPAYQV
jgi:hypothetical protein